jgi:hypothetical protein
MFRKRSKCVRAFMWAFMYVDLCLYPITLTDFDNVLSFILQRLQAASEMQAIIEAIMLADKDSNSFISEKELDEMMIRLRVFASPSSSISEDEIRSAFKKAMTSQGASLGRIHSHLLAQEEAASEDDEIATQLV